MQDLLNYVDELMTELKEEQPWGWETAYEYLDRVYETIQIQNS